MNGFKVIKSGFLTLIEDAGRFGFSAIGLTSSGVMDDYAYNCVNKLLENDKNTNVLEITFVGLKLQSTINTVICVCGADMGLKINGRERSLWKTLQIKKDDIIEFSKHISGQRVYLGVKGGFFVNKEFNSNSTTLREKIGGINGGKIVDGLFLPCAPDELELNNKLLKMLIPTYESSLTLRVILGYQEAYFSKEEKDKFFNSTYTITNQFDRMGCKLKGVSITPKFGGIISEAISFGAIQIPNNGQPIILLKERQTIGGYPKIGSVLPIDCFKLAQMRPNMKINFEEISLNKAQDILKKFYKIFK